METVSTEIGSYAHVYNRGAKKLPIFREKSDLWRLLTALFFLNNTDRTDPNWARNFSKPYDTSTLIWPNTWGKRNPLVAILAFCIMSNHIHLFLKETADNGISKFMHRVGTSYTKFINEKYAESGSLFESTYKLRLITDDADFRNLGVYIMVKNPFELFPGGGLLHAIENFDLVYMKTIQSPFNSLAEYAGTRSFPLIDKDLLGELYGPEEFKAFARECMLYKREQLEAAFQFI